MNKPTASKPSKGTIRAAERKTKALTLSRRMFNTNLNQPLLRQAKLWAEACDELQKIALGEGIWEDGCDIKREELESDIEELRLLLRQREWNINSQKCDECHNHKDDGHRSNCAVSNGLSIPKKDETPND